ncbi:ATP-binding protein [Klebsiella pneumoniae subsp. pneumoniae]|nr:ATP-binding protein [Klebsiella pneumoniae subsp. pneumoniae]
METTELIEALSRGEDSRHQFKENFTNADALAAEIVAFSNTAGGQIFIGVQNDGTVLGLSHADIDRLNQLISNSASQNVRPAVNPLTENVPHPNGTVMVVTVAEGVSKPYMDKNGVIWVKNGSDKRRATSREEIQRLFQQAGLVHVDETPVAGLGAGDVDLPYFEAFFEQQFGETLAQQQPATAATIDQHEPDEPGAAQRGGQSLVCQCTAVCATCLHRQGGGLCRHRYRGSALH